MTCNYLFSNRSSTPLLNMLSNGVHMSRANIERIVPLLTTFCCLFNHSLLTLHDGDFYGDTEGNVLLLRASKACYLLMYIFVHCSCLTDNINMFYVILDGASAGIVSYHISCHIRCSLKKKKKVPPKFALYLISLWFSLGRSLGRCYLY